jgi:tRNA nucleotidyltransferase/poly(A) polymerase
MTSPCITLTDQEAAIFGQLRQLRDQADLGGQVVMRAAGGWVRDRILGLPSKDIDITLSNITGSEFAQRVGLHGHVIEANPDKSKHLETTKVFLDGLEMDFVNLRSEHYTDSRIPTMQMGTPEQDASRRDLTINALFYNLETSEIEDFVGGLEDLAGMRLRTPLEPLKTFLDDPLRMLRVLRFHARFPDSSLDPYLAQALHMPEAHEAFSRKVALERAGPELLGMMGGAAPAQSVRLLLESGLYRCVFRGPGMDETLGIRQDQRNEHHCLDLLDHTVEIVRNLNQLLHQRGESVKLRALMNLAALFHDFGKMHPEGRQEHPQKPGQMRYAGHERVSARLAEEVLRAIGVGGADRALVTKVVALHMRPHQHDASSGWTPKSMGKFLRDCAFAGHDEIDNLWEHVFLHAIADSMSKGNETWREDVPFKEQGMAALRDYLALRQSQSANISKPLLSGNEIMALVPELAQGTGFIRSVVSTLLELQDACEVTTEEQARSAVMAWKMRHLHEYL